LKSKEAWRIEEALYMNVYENIVIINASLSDEEIESAIAKIKEFIAVQGGQIVKTSVWGKRKLAYEIKKQKRGLYLLLVYKVMPPAIKKLEDFYRVFEPVIKYSVIRLGRKQVEHLEKTEAASESAEPKKESQGV
jgi:small subunit ribosomal protein S6